MYTPRVKKNHSICHEDVPNNRSYRVPSSLLLFLENRLFFMTDFFSWTSSLLSQGGVSIYIHILGTVFSRNEYISTSIVGLLW